MAWYNSSWLKRKAITLTGGASGAIALYQVKLNVVYDSDMKSDFSDLRFTKLDGTTLLDSWMESHIASTSAIVWVETDTPANTVESDVYMYYGKADAVSDWDIAATFLFGDDFPGSSLDTNKWDGSTAYASVESNILTLDGGSNSGSIYSKVYNHSAGGVVIEYKGKPGSTMGWTRGVGSQKYTAAADAHKGLGGIGYYNVGEEYVKLWNYAGTAHTENLAFSNVWTDQQVKLKPAEISITISGVTSSIANTLESHPVGIFIYKCCQIQNFRVRKYAANPPTYQFGAEESAPTDGNPFWYYNLLKRRNS